MKGIYTFLGAIADYEPEWRENGVGGWNHYQYDGKEQYVPLLFLENEKGVVVAYSLNGQFRPWETIPENIPKEWSPSAVGRKVIIQDGDNSMYAISWMK